MKDQPARMHLRFDEGASALAELLWDRAPITCAAIARILPVHGEAHQAIYSGSESVLLLPQCLRIEHENATADVRPGDVAFAWMAAGSSYGVTADFAEICWFYDIDAMPRMWEGPVPVNIFARIIGDAQAFYAVCRRMRREGVKPLSIELAP